MIGRYHVTWHLMLDHVQHGRHRYDWSISHHMASDAWPYPTWSWSSPTWSAVEIVDWLRVWWAPTCYPPIICKLSWLKHINQPNVEIPAFLIENIHNIHTRVIASLVVYTGNCFQMDGSSCYHLQCVKHWSRFPKIMASAIYLPKHWN